MGLLLSSIDLMELKIFGEDDTVTVDWEHKPDLKFNCGVLKFALFKSCYVLKFALFKNYYVLKFSLFKNCFV